MKKISYLLGCALVAFVFVSCTDDSNTEPGSGAGASGSTVLTASIEDLVLTSLEVTPPQEGEGEGAMTQDVAPESPAHVWAKTDKLGVFGSESGINAKYTLYNESVDKSEGKFYGPEVVGEVYAYFPWQENVTASGSQLNLPFPSEQIYNADVKTQFAQNTSVYVAKASEGVVELLHPMGCIGIAIKGDVDIYSVSLSSKSKPLSGTIALDYENNFAVSTVNNSSRSVKLTLETPVHVDMFEPTVFYLMLPPATYDDLAIAIDTNEGSFGKDLAGEYQVERISLTNFEGSVGNATIVADFEMLTLDGTTDSAAKAWSEGSVMGIFAGDAVNSKYSLLAGEAGKTEATFKGIEAKGDVVAYYPYSADAKLDGSKLTVSVPATQEYYADLFTHFKANTPFVVAKAAEGEKLTFEYVTGVIAIKVKAECTVKSIAVSSPNKGIAGNMVVDLDNNYAITPAASGSRSLVSLNCGEGVVSTNADPTTFYVLLPPATYNGLAVRVTTTDGDTLIANLDNNVEIQPLTTTAFDKDVSYITVTVSKDASLLANKSNKQIWTADDVLSVFDATSQTIKQGILISGENTATGEFKVAGATEADVYEWVAWGPSMAMLQGSLTFNYRNTASLVGADKAYGTALGAMFGRNNGGKFALKSLMGCMAIRVKGSGTLKALTIKNGSQVISTDSKMSIDPATATQAVPSWSFIKSSAEPTYIYINTDMEIALSSSEYTTLYVDVPAGIDWNALQIGIVTSECSYVKSVAAPTVNANAAPVNVLDVDLTAVANKASGATALDEGGKHANCYIVAPNGGENYYSFELKHVNGVALANDQMVGAEWTYAQTAWATSYNLVDEVYLSRANGKVAFRHDGIQEGNAKLAITNDTYKIGWVYHIWCTDTPQDVYMEGTADGKLSITQYRWLDRNLGATYAPHTVAECKNISAENAAAACGLIFQYGNLNGYPGAEVMTVETKNETSNFAHRKNYVIYGFDSYVQGSFKTSNSLKASADGAISYPNYIYSKANHAGTSQWFNGDIECYGTQTTLSTCLWWTVNSNPNSVAIKDKSKYDPCPYGYCIPNQGMIYRALQCKGELNTSNTAARRYYTAVYNGEVAYGSYCVSDDDVNVYWFPNGGYGAASNKNVGAASYIYASRNSASNTQPTLNGPAYMVCTSKEGDNATTAGFGASYSGGGSVSLTTGYQIRCIRQMKQ